MLPFIPQTILVYTIGEALGDAFLRLPFFQQLRREFPEARITILARRDSAYRTILRPLMERLVDEIYTNTHIGRSWGQVVKPKWGEAYDLIFTFHRAFRSTCILKRIPHRYFVARTLKWLLSDLRPSGFLWSRPAHSADIFLQLLEAVTGRTYDAQDYQVNVPQDFLRKAQGLKREKAGEGGKLALLAPGAGERKKCWPLPYFVALARHLKEKGWHVGYLLGPGDLDHMGPLKIADKEACFPLQEWTDPSIYTTLALGHMADLCVANDAGVGHILAATPTPLVTLFGITPPEGWKPLTKNSLILEAEGKQMSNLEPEDVFKAIEEWLAQNKRSEDTQEAVA